MLPRYFTPGVSPPKERPMLPLAPVLAAAGAVTVMLPASALPSTHVKSVKLAGEVGTPQPWTQTVYVSAAGFRRLTSSAAVPPPLEPTSVAPR